MSRNNTIIRFLKHRVNSRVFSFVILFNFNHNFFGIHQSVEIKLISTEAEQKATVLLVNKHTASKYISNASAIRLKPLKWVLIDAENALIFGEPMLPVDGKPFWQKGNFIWGFIWNFCC